MHEVIGWIGANWIEALGFATGIASVWLFARQQVAAWPVGIVTSLCWLVLFLHRACTPTPDCRSSTGQVTVICADKARHGDPRPSRGSPEFAVQSFFAADTSTHTTPLLPSWSAITVSEGALLSSTTVPPAARAAAIRCSATSGAT